MKAIILCAGEGERLKPLTENIPKPLIQIGSRPILAHILLSLPDKIDQFFLVIKEKNKVFFEEFLKVNSFNKKVNIIFQGEEKGTYYALLAAREYLKNEENFLVLNGDDIFLKEDLENLILEKTPCYGLSYKKLNSRYRTCDLDVKNKKILVFRKQNENEVDKEIPCFSGALTLNKDFFNYKPVCYENNEAGIPHTLFANNHNVSFFILKEWFQINVPSDVKYASQYFK